MFFGFIYSWIYFSNKDNHWLSTAQAGVMNLRPKNMMWLNTANWLIWVAVFFFFFFFLCLLTDKCIPLIGFKLPPLSSWACTPPPPCQLKMSAALRPTQQRQAHPGNVCICAALLESFTSQQRAAASLHSVPEIRHPHPHPYPRPRPRPPPPTSDDLQDSSFFSFFIPSISPPQHPSLVFRWPRTTRERDITVPGRRQGRENIGNKRWSATKCISYPAALLPSAASISPRHARHL